MYRLASNNYLTRRVLSRYVRIEAESREIKTHFNSIYDLFLSTIVCRMQDVDFIFNRIMPRLNMISIFITRKMS